nr:hypothetical protein [Capnocytophaga canimorsus]
MYTKECTSPLARANNDFGVNPLPCISISVVKVPMVGSLSSAPTLRLFTETLPL